MTTSIQSLGGKARAANMTPEERTKAARHAATKGARKLGKEGRRLRALKGVATRKARAEAARKWGSTPAVEAEIDALERLKRPLPKAGTMAAKVLEAMRMSVDAAESDTIGIRVESQYDHEDPRHWIQVRNVLSSLRSAGHVVSEPKPGSRREKLWRLA